MTDTAVPIDQPAEAHGAGDSSPEPRDGWWHLHAPGLADDRWVDTLRARLRPPRGGERIVLDLSHTILTAAAPVLAALHTASRAAGAPERVAVVTSRFSALALLRRWGVTDTHEVFTDIDDARSAFIATVDPSVPTVSLGVEPQG